MPSLWQDKQMCHACACFLCGCPYLCRGSVQAGRSLCACGPCTLVCATVHMLAYKCRGRASHPAHCMPVQCVCAVLMVGGTYGLVAGHPCVLSRACACMHACCLQRFLSGTLSWWGRRGLHKPVPDYLALCSLFSMLVGC